MKIMQILVLILFSLLGQSNVWGLSLTYDGFECLNPIDANDLTSTETPIQSRLEVIEDLGGGMFRLSLTGGIPRFVNNSQNVCIDNATALGYSGIPALDGLPRPLESIDATAYFNGKDLVIVISSLFTDLSARRDPFSSFSTSQILTITNTLILEFDSQAFAFNLKKLIHNRGFIHTRSGSINSIPFLETLIPSFNEVAQDKPRVLTPASAIEYLIEQ